jgi:hypothetical protein
MKLNVSSSFLEKGGAGMTIVLIIVTIVAAIYLYAALAYYYGFKNWYPLCGCKGPACGPKRPL